MKETLFSLAMIEKNLDKLLSKIAVFRFVNLHFKGYSVEYVCVMEMVKRIKEEIPKDYYIDIDIRDLPNSARKKDDLDKKRADIVRKIINRNLSRKKFKHWLHKSVSIDNVLEQLNERLEKPALIIFHQFKDPNSQKEKDILTSIRKFIEMKSSLLLGILIISNHKTVKWDLTPWSPLDERHIEFFPISVSNNKGSK